MRPAAFWHGLSRRLLSADPKRRTIVAMALLGLLLMIASATVMLLLAHWGAVESPGAVRWWAALSVGGLAAMALLIRCGATAGLRDPSLMVPQMAWTITSGAVAYVLAGPAKGLVPSVLAMILFFGALGLGFWSAMGIGLYAMAAFAVAVFAAPRFYAGTYEVMDLAYGLMILIVLVGCMAINVRIQHIRSKLDRKRQALAEALAINRELALRDDLTGLLNRRAMVELLHVERRRGQRQDRTLLLAMLDLDHFKRVNDVHGHALGDLALQAFAEVALASVRETEVLARWGGDEFLLMLSATSVPDACVLLERLRVAVQAMEIAQIPGPLGITLSAGLAMLQPGETLPEAIHRADEALYAAKAQGRNRLVLAPGTPPQGGTPLLAGGRAPIGRAASILKCNTLAN